MFSKKYLELDIESEDLSEFQAWGTNNSGVRELNTGILYKKGDPEDIEDILREMDN